MADGNVQQTLDQILERLKGNDPEGYLQALEELNSLKYSSPAILKELERLAAQHLDVRVQQRAAQSLETSVHQFVRRNINKLNRGDRVFLLKQIAQWEEDGLLPASIADVISARYNFDILPAQTSSTSSPVIREIFTPVSPQPAVPTGPRPSLTQTLLSEASIKIYLYLGAFFVIAAALILAAVVEAARLPILAVATLAFGGVALLLRKRLPQPSFALFIVFSFLFLIDANVLKETIGFTGTSRHLYWTLLFFMMAMIWGFSAWLYESRFFSAVAFAALSLAFYRAGKIFNAEIEAQIFLGILASFAGLAEVLLLRKWKGVQFSQVVFLLAQIQVMALLFTSLALVLGNLVGLSISAGSWPLKTLTWLTAAFFFILSNLLNSYILFPWMAVTALLPLPWFLFNAVHATPPAHAFGFLIWGAILALASEASLRLPLEKTKQYYWALLAGSVPLVLTSIAIALDWDTPDLTFAIFLLTALVYGGLHLARPRWYVWSAALLSGLAAFFAFFALPNIERFDVPFLYELLIAGILLVVPELFAKSPLSWKTETRWPSIALGIFVSGLGIFMALVDVEQSGQGALALMIYAVLFTVHAVHSRREWLAYFATVCETLALIYALIHFNLDLWLPALTILSLLYYAAGFFFRRGADELKVWGNVFINGGLTLGIFLSLTSLVLSKETSGWYIILIALLFAIEIFTRPWAELELIVEGLFSISLYLILKDLNTTDIGHFLFGTSLIWLGGDIFFGRLLQQKRVYRLITLAVGCALLLLSTFIWLNEPDPVTPAIYFALYAVFFAVYALLQREARLGYLATAFLSLVLLKLSEIVNYEKWAFPLILLAGLYYGSGYWLRRNQRSPGWDQMFLYSGLGLAVLTSLGATSQGGLDSSIPVAIAATLFAAEALALRNIWWALPANLLYLMSYFIILLELNVDEPQFYSIGAALLGMLMHYLLTRAGSKTGSFLAGMLSQLVLLGTTYIQMVSTEKLSFFFVLFIQSMVVLIYGLTQRSRSLVITPIAFSVIGVVTVIYSALKGLGPVILIGSTGVLLLMAGIVAVLMRERITRLGEQLSDWKP